MRKRPPLLHNSATQDVDAVFKLTRRKGSSLWQVRKRWPQDVVGVLPGEFTRSTGEADKRRAQERLPLVAAEYESRVKAARDRLADNKQRDLSEPEMHRLAAAFYRDALPAYRIGNAVSPVDQDTLLRDTRARIEALTKMQARKEFAPVAATARGMIQREGLPVPEDSPSLPALQALLMRALIELHRGVIAQLEGVTDYSPTDPVVGELATKDAKRAQTVLDLIKAYKEAKWDGWSQSTRVNTASVFRLLTDAIGDREVASITREDARSIQTLVRSLPAGLGRLKALRGLPVPKAVEMGRKLDLPTISPKTVNDGYLVHISALFRWAVQEGWATRNEFTGLSIADPVSAHDKRDPFTPEQLKTLFAADPWAAPGGLTGNKPGRYWVPLIALFSGMRLGEIAGLRIMDIDKREGIDLFLIRPHEGRSLKTEGSRRDLPIHSELRRLGLLAYVEKRRREGAPTDLLFPDAKANVRGQAGAKLGEWFTKLLREREVTGVKLGMHSFRHNFEDRLRAIGLHGTAQGLALAGRAASGSASIYGKGYTVVDASHDMERIGYPDLDLSHLQPLQEAA